MKHNIIQYLKEKIVYFNDKTISPNKLVGCSEKELTYIQSVYKYPIPKIINDLYQIGGHNFFQFYYLDNVNCGYKIVEDIYQNYEEWFFQNIMIDLKKNFVFEYSTNNFYYCDLTIGENSPVYHYFGEGKVFEVNKVFDTISDYFYHIIDTQQRRFEHQQKMILANCFDYDYLYKLNSGLPEELREEIERQFQNYKEGENWSDYLKIAEQNYQEMLNRQENHSSAEDLPF